ncbi:hypothetical protein MDAP_001283 [Mitosporidium daphniae]
MCTFLHQHALPLLFGILTYMMIGGFWYSESMFQSIFLKANNKDKSDCDSNPALTFMLIIFFGMLEVIGVLLLLHAIGAKTILDSLLAVYILWQFFYVPSICIHFVLDQRNVSLMLVNLGYSLAILASVAMVRTLWMFYL